MSSSIEVYKRSNDLGLEKIRKKFILAHPYASGKDIEACLFQKSKVWYLKILTTENLGIGGIRKKLIE